MPMDAIEKEENVYAAEALLKDRRRKGKIEYLVKWKGWSAKHNSWEPRENILDERLFAEYEARKAKKNDRKRSSTSSATSKKSPLTKKSKRLSAAEHHKLNDDDSDDNDNLDDDEGLDDASTPSPSTSKSPRKRGAPKGRISKDREKEKNEIVVPEGDQNDKRSSTDGAVDQKKNDVSEDDKNKITDEKSTPAKETTTGDKEREESRSDESLQTPTRLQQTAEIAKDSSTLPERKSSESAKDSSTAAVAPSTSTDQTNLQTTPSKTANEEHGQELEGEGAKKKVDDDDLKQEEESSPKASADESSKESEQPPKVFHGHMTSIQIASSSNGQGQHVNMSAFVVSQPGASGSTEQLQVCENEDLAKIQAIKNEIISETKNWTDDANNVRHESFQYNGTHTITEVTVNQHTVPIVEI